MEPSSHIRNKAKAMKKLFCVLHFLVNTDPFCYPTAFNTP